MNMREINSKETIKYCPVCGAVYCYGIAMYNIDKCGDCKSEVVDTGKTLQDYFDELYIEDAGDVQEYIRKTLINDNPLFDKNKAYDRIKESEDLKHHIEKLHEESDRKEAEENTPHCPYCGSTSIQLVPKKWSILTGFLTNKVDRYCVNCKKKF